MKASGDSSTGAKKKGGNTEAKGSCKAGVDQTARGSNTNEAKGRCKAGVDKAATGSETKEGKPGQELEPRLKSGGQGETGGSIATGEGTKSLKEPVGLGTRQALPLESHAAICLLGTGKVDGDTIEVPKGKTEEKGGCKAEETNMVNRKNSRHGTKIGQGAKGDRKYMEDGHARKGEEMATRVRGKTPKKTFIK